MFGSIVIRQRFWFALGANLLLFLIARGNRRLGADAARSQVQQRHGAVFRCGDQPDRQLHQMEYDSRRTYLQTLLQRIEAIKLQRSRDELELQAKIRSADRAGQSPPFDSRLNSERLRAQAGNRCR